VLVLTRQKEQRIRIGDDGLVLQVLKVKGDKVSLGFFGSDTPIVRDELGVEVKLDREVAPAG